MSDSQALTRSLLYQRHGHVGRRSSKGVPLQNLNLINLYEYIQTTVGELYTDKHTQCMRTHCGMYTCTLEPQTNVGIAGMVGNEGGILISYVYEAIS